MARGQDSDRRGARPGLVPAAMVSAGEGRGEEDECGRTCNRIVRGVMVAPHCACATASSSAHLHTSPLLRDRLATVSTFQVSGVL